MNGNDIVLFLKSVDIEAYLPNTHIGECKTNYVVVKSEGRNPIPGISTSQQRYDILCYVPQSMRSKLEDFVLKVEKSLVELGKVMAIKTMNIRSNDYYDETIRGHVMSTSFRVYYLNE